jgi:hypothetical protein
VIVQRPRGADVEASMVEFITLLVLLFSPLSAPLQPGGLPIFPSDGGDEPQPPADPCTTGEVTRYDANCGTN